jgi:broad-specificity NMP kinase
MTCVLVTGMSGTGKSTLLAELERRGVRVVDTDDAPWSHEVPDPDGPGLMQLWREESISRLLDEAGPEPLVVSGTASNQGRFYGRFEAVVLLSAPTDVLLERLRTREGNPFGKDPQEVERILRDIEEVQPLLRATSTLELDATRPVGDLADEIASLLH